MSSIQQLVNDTISHAEQYQNNCDGDYIKDGLLHCGNCNTPKQCEITLDGRKRIVYCLCDCGKVEQERIEADLKNNMHNADINRIRDIGIQDAYIRECKFENNDSMSEAYTKKAIAYCMHWDEMKQGNYGLYIYGSSGSGKTFLTGCIANKMIDNGVSVLTTTFSKLIKEIWAAENKNKVIADAVSYPLLIIDDFGVENMSGYNQEQIYTIIDERYKSNKPMIITSNIPYAELVKPKSVSDARIYSRIAEVCSPIEITGGRRLKMGVSKAKALNDILGV